MIEQIAINVFILFWCVSEPFCGLIFTYVVLYCLLLYCIVLSVDLFVLFPILAFLWLVKKKGLIKTKQKKYYMIGLSTNQGST